MDTLGDDPSGDRSTSRGGPGVLHRARASVDRPDAVEALSAALLGAADGEAGVLVLAGVAGMGATAVIEAAIDGVRGQVPDLVSVTVRGLEGDPPWPFDAVIDVLVDLASYGSEVQETAEATLARCLDGPTGDTTASSRGPAIALGVHRAVASLARRSSLVVLVVEDAQWLDPDSARALRVVARRLGADRVAVIVAHRTPLEGSVWCDAPRLSLGPLAAEAQRTLVRSVAGRPVDRRVEDVLVASCGGNPLALTEVVRSLSADQLSAAVPLGDPLPIGPMLEKALLAGVEGLDDGARWAVLLVATSGVEIDAHDVRAALGRMGIGPDGADRVGPAGVVSGPNGRLGFADPLVRAAVLGAASAEDRRRAHVALAGVERDPLRAVWHRAHGCREPDEAVAAAVADAAARTLERGGPASASMYFELAARLTIDPVRRAERILGAAIAALESGHVTELARLVNEGDRLLDAVDAPPAQLALLRARVEAARLFDGGRPQEGLALLSLAAHDHAAERPVDSAAALLDTIPVALRTGRPDLAEAAARRASELLDAPTEPGGRQRDDGGARAQGERRLRIGQAAAATARGEPGADEMLEAALAEEGDTTPDTFVVECAGLARIWAERLDEARRSLDTFEVRCRADGALGPLAVVRGLQAFAALRSSRLRDAAAAASEATELALTTGRSGLTTFPDSVAAVVAAMRGDTVECLAAADRLLAAAVQGSEVRWEVPARAARGLLALGQGRPEETVAELLPLVGPTPSQPWLVMWEPDLAEALWRLGRRDEAGEVIRRLEGASAHRPLRAVAATHRLFGLLADDGDEGLKHLEVAAASYRRAGAPFGVGRVRLNQGSLLRRMRRRVDARRMLEDAHRTFDQIGADQWAKAALVELRATGGGAGIPDPVTLTPQELQVASLVAAGRSNRDVAAALFVSPRTVESHLGRVYRKMGVRTRAELAARAGELETP